MKYQINGVCKTDIGLKRQNNEDNYYFDGKIFVSKKESSELLKINFNSETKKIFGVFDGMGGEENGEVASMLVSSSMKQEILDNFEWHKYIYRANKKIVDAKIFGGTTLAGIFFNKDNLEICNLGDSRIYGLKDGKLFQLSQDHNEQSLMKRLNIKQKSKGALTQHLGLDPNDVELSPYIAKYSIDDYDMLLLCSDGLTDMVDNQKIAEILNLNGNISFKINLLIKESMLNGGIDNTTIMLFEIKREKKPILLICLVSMFLLIMLIVIFIINNHKFKIISDTYKSSIKVGEQFEFKFSHGNISLSNDNIIYQNGVIKAQKEGKTIITIKDDNGDKLYEKVIIIFPN